MSKTNENQPLSFEEALQGRPGGLEIEESLPPDAMDDPGPMTEDEVLEQALGEEKAEMMLGTNFQEIPETPMNIPDVVEMASMILPHTPPEAPASTIALPPVDMPSTQVYPPQGQTEENSPKKRFEEFVRGPEFTVSWVEQHLQQFSDVPFILPSPSTWAGLGGMDVAKAVHDFMRSPSFLNRIWRQLEMVMGLSVDNTPWCVEVACSMMLFHFLWYLSE